MEKEPSRQHIEMTVYWGSRKRKVLMHRDQIASVEDFTVSRTGILLKSGVQLEVEEPYSYFRELLRVEV